MNNKYVHGYDLRENIRLQDQASTLEDLLHADTAYPANSKILEAGCGVGAQTPYLWQKIAHKPTLHRLLKPEKG